MALYLLYIDCPNRSVCFLVCLFLVLLFPVFLPRSATVGVRVYPIYDIAMHGPELTVVLLHVVRLAHDALDYFVRPISTAYVYNEPQK